jgi:hypothetical protein
MKANRHQVALCALILVALLSACQKASKQTLKIGINRITHIAVGQSVHLSAYQEYKPQANDPDAAQAASTRNTLREAITPKWSVSDSSLASLSDNGTLTALKPGRVTIKSAWEKYEGEASVEVVKDLPVGYLPQLSASGTNCQPQAVALNFAADRSLKFRLSFDDSRCQEASLEASAPEQPLPWKFDFQGGTLELTEAHGLIVTGKTHTTNGTDVSFKAWSEGDGTYPISLANKTVLLTGDSMSEGIGWTMKEKVQAAGGRLIVQPVYSSTTVQWEAEGKMRQYIEQYHPDIIFIALGSNEIFISDMTSRSKAVREIAAEIGDRPAYWIGPPSWKPDKGIVHAIEENFRPGHFYNANDLVVPRRRDGAHPTPDGFKTWTDLIWDWYAKVG